MSKRLGTAFIMLTSLLLLIVGGLIGYRVHNEVEENGLCFHPTVTVDGVEHTYDFCIIQPPEEVEDDLN